MPYAVVKDGKGGYIRKHASEIPPIGPGLPPRPDYFCDHHEVCGIKVSGRIAPTPEKGRKEEGPRFQRSRNTQHAQKCRYNLGVRLTEITERPNIEIIGRGGRKRYRLVGPEVLAKALTKKPQSSNAEHERTFQRMLSELINSAEKVESLRADYDADNSGELDFFEFKCGERIIEWKAFYYSFERLRTLCLNLSRERFQDGRQRAAHPWPVAIEINTWSYNPVPSLSKSGQRPANYYLMRKLALKPANWFEVAVDNPDDLQQRDVRLSLWFDEPSFVTSHDPARNRLLVLGVAELNMGGEISYLNIVITRAAQITTTKTNRPKPR